MTWALPWLYLALTEACFHALYQEVHFGIAGYLLGSSQVEDALVSCYHLLLATGFQGLTSVILAGAVCGGTLWDGS